MGSGTVGEACLRHGRKFLLIDSNEEAIAVMKRRFAAEPEIEWVGVESDPEPSTKQPETLFDLGSEENS